MHNEDNKRTQIGIQNVITSFSLLGKVIENSYSFYRAINKNKRFYLPQSFFLCQLCNQIITKYLDKHRIQLNKAILKLFKQ